MIKLTVKVVPGASKSEVSGWLGDALKVRVAAPPEKGKANLAVVALLLKTFGLAKGSVNIISGDTSQLKIVELRGVSEARIRQVLGDRDA